MKKFIYRTAYKTACIMTGYIGQEISRAIGAFLAVAVIIPLFLALLLIS